MSISTPRLRALATLSDDKENILSPSSKNIILGGLGLGLNPSFTTPGKHYTPQKYYGTPLTNSDSAIINKLKDQLATEKSRRENELSEMRQKTQNQIQALTITNREAMISRIKGAVLEQQHQHDKHVHELNSRWEVKIGKVENELRGQSVSKTNLLEKNAQMMNVDFEKQQKLAEDLAMSRTQVLSLKSKQSKLNSVISKQKSQIEQHREQLSMLQHDERNWQNNNNNNNKKDNDDDNDDDGIVAKFPVWQRQTFENKTKTKPSTTGTGDLIIDTLFFSVLLAFFSVVFKSLLR